MVFYYNVSYIIYNGSIIWADLSGAPALMTRTDSPGLKTSGPHRGQGSQEALHREQLQGLHKNLSLYIYIHVHICMYLSVHSFVYRSKYMQIYIYICIHVCIYVCMYICMYICIDRSSSHPHIQPNVECRHPFKAEVHAAKAFG